MISCPNCGAEIEENVTKCPYCGYMNVPGVEKKINEEIEEIKTNIEEEKKEPVKALKKGLFSGVRTVALTVVALLIVIGIIVVMLLYETKDRPRLYLTAKQEAEAAAYRAMAKEKIAVAYENKDVEQLAEIFDTAYSVERVTLWGDPHYDAAQAASNYESLMRCMPNLDKEKMKKKEAEEITYYCFYFYYGMYGEDGAEIFDSVRDDEIVPIVHDRLGFSEEDMQQLRYELIASGNLNRSKMYYATKKYFKNYH